MICPKCGTEIKEGYLYCSKCGEEIKIVPDFEVELETGIEETISEVAEIIADSVEEAASEEAEKVPDVKPLEEKRKKNNIGPSLLIASAVILGLLFAFGVFKLVKTIDSYYSFDVQYAKAKTEFDEGRYEDAVKTAKHAVSLNKKNAGPRLLLSDAYKALDKYDESIAVLNDLLNDYPTDRKIYERLLADYEAEGDTDSILRLSEKPSAAEMADLFAAYVSMPPVFSIEGGVFYEPQSVELTAEGKGTIHYTTDGSEPSAASAAYSGPILIEEGETIVSAVYVNEKGVASETVSMTYDVEIIQVALPRLITNGGDYSMPQLIKLEDPVEGIIHYTSDGTDPNANSPEFEPPVLMPLGKSEFKFVIINSKGRSSDVVSAEYNLKINGIIDQTYAQSAVQLKLIALGHAVLDHSFKAAYGYSHEGRSYYVVEEYAGGKKQSTLYAVDAQTGEVFTITRNSDKGDFDFGMVM